MGCPVWCKARCASSRFNEVSSLPVGPIIEAHRQRKLEVDQQEKFSSPVSGDEQRFAPQIFVWQAFVRRPPARRSVRAPERQQNKDRLISSISSLLPSYIVSYHTSKTSSKMGKEKAHVRIQHTQIIFSASHSIASTPWHSFLRHHCAPLVAREFTMG